ncbi:RNB domain-containing ribonuclease [Granulicella sibirica]|uniref:3'-to-5' exoribonuclease RNase R n=1 Tax=Granulicella sibirica TaxID=2479048 RepID=A0A4Q0T5J6_9BACT|nr:RNB domain-containing ribonuclease [Granulicella sibirica]RXH57358.1 3'-to-5' exoribonuclease RNase R [Granulicella sibirica]
MSDQQSPAPFSIQNAAAAEMIHNNFRIGFAPEVEEQVAAIRREPAELPNDCKSLLWSSIDNDTSRDLDQVEYAERTPDGIRVLVGIANVAGTVAKDSPIDRHAADQTLTVYTAVHNFPMLPLELSTDLTSLNEDRPRSAVVVEFTVTPDGQRTRTRIYEAEVLNHAQLAYSRVGPWLEGTADPDAKVAADADLQSQLKLQDEAAHALHALRVRNGALEFNRSEADPIVLDGVIHGIRTATHNRAMDLIEELMIASNETMAQTLRQAGRSCIRRIVQVPARWDRIVELVARHGTQLPPTPDAAPLNAFLQAQRAADPDRYPDLALSVIKLMGPGQYVLAKGVPGPNDPLQGHFGLAAQDYAHSTAPNRRFVDLVTQRIVKAFLAGEPPPYTDDELTAIAARCLEREGAARKVERAMIKRVAAVALTGSIGKSFRGVVVGATGKGTYVRIFDPPVEGRIIRNEQGLDVGDTVNVNLVHTDPAHAYIDFARA